METTWKYGLGLDVSQGINEESKVKITLQIFCLQNQSPSSNFQRFSQLPDLLFSKQYFQNRAEKGF